MSSAIGKLEAIYLDNTPDVLNTGEKLRPAAGEEWIISYMGVYHSNAAATDLTWIIKTPQGSFTLVTESLGAGTARWFVYHNYGSWFTDLRLTHDIYPMASVAALDAGTFIKIRGIVTKRPVNFDLQVVEMFANYMGYKLPIKSRE